LGEQFGAPLLRRYAPASRVAQALVGDYFGKDCFHAPRLPASRAFDYEAPERSLTSHQPRIDATAKAAVSWSVPMFTQPRLRAIS